ncbi:unnamed protein product [Amoebophrya sp. A120]|nr:unnamed protein product [Amoebophrya sp. A120]|eukprot:GSA120T00000008001.1
MIQIQNFKHSDRKQVVVQSLQYMLLDLLHDEENTLKHLIFFFLFDRFYFSTLFIFLTATHILIVLLPHVLLPLTLIKFHSLPSGILQDNLFLTFHIQYQFQLVTYFHMFFSSHNGSTQCIARSEQLFLQLPTCPKISVELARPAVSLDSHVIGKNKSSLEQIKLIARIM